ncbi:GntR family transcriptional regulator [Nocardia sp. NPDC051463]|uniref:GntR family transcriptional regulator n=1 Tax=Nocardia sp. NPDC051463 TaxID=3154845 RepID=UPI00344DF08A
MREAMLDLVKEGLVDVVPDKGFRITEIGESDLDEITELRLLIEPPVVRLVPRHIPAEDLPVLRELAQVIVDCANEGNLVADTEADRVFHLCLLSYARESARATAREAQRDAVLHLGPVDGGTEFSPHQTLSAQTSNLGNRPQPPMLIPVPESPTVSAATKTWAVRGKVHRDRWGCTAVVQRRGGSSRGARLAPGDSVCGRSTASP